MMRARKPGRRTDSGGTDAAVNRYQMRQKLVTFGDDFFIENSAGQRVFKVDGKVLRVRDTLFFRDMQGNELCKIQERLARIKDSMEIESPTGERLAMVKKALITPIRDRWIVKIGNGPDMDVQGSILGLEYRITDGSNSVAQVSRKWFRLRDTYGVEIAPGQNDVVLLAVTVVLDMMAHEGR